MQAKYDLLSKTKMIDYTNQIYKEINGLEEEEENEPGGCSFAIWRREWSGRWNWLERWRWRKNAHCVPDGGGKCWP